MGDFSYTPPSQTQQSDESSKMGRSLSDFGNQMYFSPTGDPKEVVERGKLFGEDDDSINIFDEEPDEEKQGARQSLMEPEGHRRPTEQEVVWMIMNGSFSPWFKFDSAKSIINDHECYNVLKSNQIPMLSKDPTLIHPDYFPKDKVKVEHATLVEPKLVQERGVHTVVQKIITERDEVRKILGMVIENHCKKTASLVGFRGKYNSPISRFADITWRVQTEPTMENIARMWFIMYGAFDHNPRASGDLLEGDIMSLFNMEYNTEVERLRPHDKSGKALPVPRHRCVYQQITVTKQVKLSSINKTLERTIGIRITTSKSKVDGKQAKRRVKGRFEPCFVQLKSYTKWENACDEKNLDPSICRQFTHSLVKGEKVPQVIRRKSDRGSPRRLQQRQLPTQANIGMCKAWRNVNREVAVGKLGESNLGPSRKEVRTTGVSNDVGLNGTEDEAASTLSQMKGGNGGTGVVANLPIGGVKGQIQNASQSPHGSTATLDGSTVTVVDSPSLDDTTETEVMSVSKEDETSTSDEGSSVSSTQRPGMINLTTERNGKRVESHVAVGTSQGIGRNRALNEELRALLAERTKERDELMGKKDLAASKAVFQKKQAAARKSAEKAAAETTKKGAGKHQTKKRGEQAGKPHKNAIATRKKVRIVTLAFLE